MGAILAAHEEKAPKRPGQHQLSIRQWDEVCKTINMSLREQQVCKLLFDGMTRQKIAEKLEISNRTVRHHMEQIHLKLEVSNRVGVVLQIIRLRDLLSTPPPDFVSSEGNLK
jgi:DNA-binding NarL/FixJ family response regulator